MQGEPKSDLKVREIGYRRTCACPPRHINCLTAKEWLKSQLGVWQFYYEGRDIRDKNLHPATFPISLARHVIKLFTDQYFPSHFIQVKTKGDLANPALLLDPTPRRVSQYFEEGETYEIEGLETDDEEDDGDDDGTGLIPEDPYFTRGEKGPSTFDTRHVVTASVVQVLPFDRWLPALRPAENFIPPL